MTKRFSDIYNLGLSQPQLDFVDIIPSVDNPLFIDPFAISTKDDSWSQVCHQHITNFFETALGYVRSGQEVEAQLLLNGLSEPNETCFGVSRGSPQGRGVSGKQALDLYDSLAKSQAAKSGLLEELADCDLFVEGIGRDKISDITTNIIRRLLIQYTQQQCELHSIALTGTYPSGRYWDITEKKWKSEYVELPVIDRQRIILVPKYSVRLSLALNSQEYYSHHILNFIRDEELAQGSSLVRTLKNGSKRVFKTDLKKKFPFSKDFVARFSEAHPNVLKSYKALYGQIQGASGTLKNEELNPDYDEVLFAKALLLELESITSGAEKAGAYHAFMVGVLEFIFWPNLIHPNKEKSIHDGRKRIDITYTNAAISGFFYRAHSSHQIASNLVMVECKNYAGDPKNPELDQLAGRFSVNRGKLGILVYRDVADYGKMLKRCKDTAADGRGFVLPLGDTQIIEYLGLIGNRNRSQIDVRLENILLSLIS